MGIPKKTIRPMFKKDKWKILRGDTVMITAGKDRGRTGTVSRVIRDSRKPLVVVEGLNLRKRFNKATQEQQGSMISVEGPIAYSSVQLIDPSTKLPVRITWRFTEDGDKVRETRGHHATSSIIPRPDVLSERRKPAPLPGLYPDKQYRAEDGSRVMRVLGWNPCAGVEPLHPGARDTGLTEALRQTFVPGDRPSFLQQRPHQPYSSSAWSNIAGSICTRRRTPSRVVSLSYGFAAGALLQQ